MKPALLIILTAALLLTGCGPSSSKDASPLLKKLVGKSCIVQFDRQVLGVANPLPIAPETSSVNGAGTCVTGILKKYDTEWIVLEFEKTQTYIPVEHILLIQHHR